MEHDPLSKKFFEDGILELKRKTEEFARQCAEKGRPKALGDRFSIYVGPIRSWYSSFIERIKSKLGIDVLSINLSQEESQLVNSLSDLTKEKEQLLARLQTLKSKKDITPPISKLERRILFIAHCLVALTESATIASAFQIFGGTALVSVVLFLALVAFFYFLPIVLNTLISRFKIPKHRILVGLASTFLISALFYFLGSIRASYSQALDTENIQTLSATGFMIFNWMFLSLGLYLAYRREVFAKNIVRDMNSKNHFNEIETIQKRIESIKQTETRLSKGTQERIALYSTRHATYLSYCRIIQAEFIESVELYKTIIVTTNSGDIPDCFDTIVEPLRFSSSLQDGNSKV